jgi:NADPH:quinone reductase-like Zn-dependent oxidoreductase
VVLVAGDKGRWLRPLALMVKGTLTNRFVSQRIRPVMAKITKEDLAAMSDLLSTGQVVPTIDRTYPLSETAEALTYLESGHARGKVVIVP